MYSYRHSFHAGNFADVFKHTLLIILIRLLQKKEKGFFYLETHAGRGLYDLNSPQAQKNKEYKQGIAKIYPYHKDNHYLKTYFHIIDQFNKEQLLNYPGSPIIAAHLLRPQDRLLAIDALAPEVDILQQAMTSIKNSKALQQDGYQALKAYLPPIERRGLVFIDPPYDYHDEVKTLLKGLSQAIERWQTGVYAIWYPLLRYKSMQLLKEKIPALPIKSVCYTELTVLPSHIEAMYGCGMLILNPPWQLDHEIQSILPYLWQSLKQTSDTGYILDYLKKD